ncbi:hypothetical protein SASPL_137247 [Salvia splendens]|uniref:Germin-like protein n=1 Tax=Salvia splendens TaxID=180675 RepID=A0A8X8WT32_SALSN|nr:hypothetical protein SASPL_137247 [Salvia splendens]
MTGVVVLFSTLALNLLCLALAFDPSPLEDFCVLDAKSPDARSRKLWNHPTYLTITHPRAAEILTILEGSMEVGFVTSFPTYKHYSKVLNKGDVFVVPVGLPHYQRGVGKVNTVVLSAVNSQNAGIVEAGGSMFGAKPAINSDYLAMAFYV